MIERSRQPLSKFVLAFAQMQDNLRAAICLLHCLKRIIAFTAGFPADAMFGRQAGTTRDERHLVRDDECRIKTDAELADQVRILGLIAGQRTEEFASTGFGDGADMVDDLLPGHADSVIRNGNGPCRGVIAHADFQV